MCRRKMKMNIRMTFSPKIPLGYMSVEIVHNDVDLLTRMFRNDLIHKVQKLPAATALVMPRFDLPRSYVQGCKESTRPMPPILMVSSGQRLPIGQFKPSLSSLQRLNRWFFIHTQDDGIFRRIQVKPNNISR